MKLSDLLKKENNNIDIFRLIAACMVIYGHAYAISPEIGKSDFIGKMMQVDYSGSLAVKIFFFLSGLVVTNSLLNNGDLPRFIISRLFRIWPALILSSIVTAFVIGPLFTSLPISEYFQKKEVYDYVINIASMNIQFTLPGVFSDNPYPNSVNGSLWTIPYEVFAYILLFSLYSVGAINSKKLSTSIFALILVEPFLTSRVLFPWLTHNHEIDFLAPCFAFGSILAINKELISIKFTQCLGFGILYLALRDTVYSPYFAYVSIFLFILYASSSKLFLTLKPKADISYGIYLWGFPVQQMVAYYLSEHGVLLNQILSLIISIAFGYFSWHLCEKKFINYGTRISIKIRTELNKLSSQKDGSRSLPHQEKI